MRGYWIKKVALSALLCIAVSLIFLTFGNGVYFDVAFATVISTLVLTLSKDNKSISSILLACLLVNFISETFYRFTAHELARYIYYALSIYIFAKFRGDWLVRCLIFPICGLSIVAELYWYLKGYSAPEVHYYLALLALKIILRQFLSAGYFRDPVPARGDYQKTIYTTFYQLSGLSCIIVSAMLIEYLVRHLTYYNPMFVYDNYTYIMQVINITGVCFIIDYTLRPEYKFNA